VSLSVFHNRRWDGQFMTARDLIEEGHIGEVFHLETSFAHYREMPDVWRADKKISGGLFYDWGSHYTDWALNLMGGRTISGVTGQFQKRVWERPTIEDHVEACIRFDDGAVAHLQISRMAALEKPRWYILGTEGALLDERQGQTKVFTRVRGHTASFSVDYQRSDWPAYYRGMLAHLTEDAPIPVTAESARRVIGVFEAAERSSRRGGERSVAHE
jgi:predicted dehydrogenase